MQDKLLIELAEKFGTTVEHLWGVMVNQAFISAFINILTMIILLSVFFIGFILIKKYKKQMGQDTIDNEPYIIACVLYAFYMLVLIISVPFMVGDTITMLLNPEYWALMRLKP